jgi:hypothetical protein
MLKMILIILAAICFGLDFFRIGHPRFSWTPGGFMFLTIALFLI